MAIAKHIQETVSSSSFIRKMFETGIRLKAEFGADQVCDFSLGNPSLPPPPEFSAHLSRLAAEPFAGKHAYMPNAGYPDVRQAISRHLGSIWGSEPGIDGIIMTCGAGGGLNVVLKTLLNPGDEVLASLPCFMEYRFYAANHGGVLKTVACHDNFDLNIEAIAAALTPKTALIIINSPNNPSGVIYPESTLRQLAAVLDAHRRKTGRTIYIVSDEPYRAISYGASVPVLPKIYPHTIVVTSYSKELSIPGERLGWIGISPAAEDASVIFDAAVVCNRILGFVNAPALMQKAVAASLGLTADVDAYRRKRDLLCPALVKMGYKLLEPAGTFYAFPRAPGGDDLAFVDRLLAERVLVVPGRGFGLAGYFRIAFCVDDAVIQRALPGFERAITAIN